ncbi:hypothetical protein EV140_1942 [Microcella alkaliphila]|uniref:Uncharacterized protein n=1 Tax=Microcella alkaliphila TaxID=279828 RepID=A0A4Q7TH77_9MICO|nr:hypothetical protein [Microcella alkaliphila]RZT59337.1 hypothetical protein EV140_1942 [Microcella alkaliphila]
MRTTGDPADPFEQLLRTAIRDGKLTPAEADEVFRKTRTAHTPIQHRAASNNMITERVGYGIGALFAVVIAGGLLTLILMLTATAATTLWRIITGT